MPTDPARALGLGSVYAAKDRTWTVAPWREGVQARYSLYLKGKAIACVRELRQEGYLTPEEAREQMAQVPRDHAAGVYLFGSELWSEGIRNSKDNLAQLFWLQVSAADSDFTLALAKQLVEDDPEGVLNAIFDANSDPSSGPNPKAPGKTTTPGQDQTRWTEESSTPSSSAVTPA